MTDLATVDRRSAVTVSQSDGDGRSMWSANEAYRRLVCRPEVSNWHSWGVGYKAWVGCGRHSTEALSVNGVHG